MRLLLGAVVVTLVGCGSSATPSPGTPQSDSGAQSDSATSADGSVEASSPMSCPHVDLGRTVPAVYQGTTDGLPDLVTSNRLEWKDAPDDSLAFEAPSDGDYLIALESPVTAMGASAEDSTITTAGGMHHPWTVATCPAAGAKNEIDGVFNHNQPMYPLPLKAGQKIVIWVSVPYWSMTVSGTYKLTVSKK